MPASVSLRGRPQAQGAVRDRLQPALLDRLVDRAPHQGRELDGAVMSRAQLREAVLRDLRWLFNTTNAQSEHDMQAYPQVRRSTLNFGLRPLSGKHMSEIDWVDLEDSIRRAILDFEPRILADSVEVRCVSVAQVLEHYNILSLEIAGVLQCVPQPQEFLFRTDIDLENGHMDLHDLGNRR